MNSAQWLVQALKAGGVERVFVLCGNGLRPFLDACQSVGMPMLDVRNEQAAAFMADATARLTRRLAVVVTSAGPGFGNAITGLLNSYWDGAPTLLISGSSEAATDGQDHFQELDQVALVEPICKHAARVDAGDRMPVEFCRAVNAATTSRPGPVHLTVPVDVWTQEVPAPPAVPSLEVGAGGFPDPAGVAAALELLDNAERPVMIAGSGCFYARATAALQEFAAVTDIPLFTSLWDRGVVEGPWPQYVGPASGEVNGAYARIAEADVILTLGARVDFRLGYGRPPVVAEEARFIRIDADPAEVHRNRTADVGLTADPRATLETLAAHYTEAEGRRHSGWLAEVQATRRAFLEEWEPEGREERLPVPSLRLMREIKPFLERDLTFLLDGGNIGRWAHMLLWDRHPERWLTCGISGVVGWGLAGAAAARLAFPRRPALLLIGDGAAGFILGDIETAVRFQAPYVAVVAHDAAWGIEADARPPGERQAVELGPIRFDRVAEALGARGVFIEEPAQIGPAIDQALAMDTVTIIHVDVELGGIEYYRRHLMSGQARQAA